jgi:hypothetical protein
MKHDSVQSTISYSSFLYYCLISRGEILLQMDLVGTRVSTEIHFVGISIGIPIEISFDFRRN